MRHKEELTNFRIGNFETRSSGTGEYRGNSPSSLLVVEVDIFLMRTPRSGQVLGCPLDPISRGILFFSARWLGAS